MCVIVLSSKGTLIFNNNNNNTIKLFQGQTKRSEHLLESFLCLIITWSYICATVCGINMVD